jgi:TrmH family RNA methyltransferase
MIPFHLQNASHGDFPKANWDNLPEMKKIESARNARIRDLKRSLSSKSFAAEFLVIEGRTLLKDALASGIELRELFVTSRVWEREKKWLGALEDQGIDIAVVGESAMERLSTVETPPGVLAIAARPRVAVRSDMEPRRFGALLFSMRDPGNLGTLVRSAEGAGFEFVACSRDTTDPMQPKALRASMGSCFRVPVFRLPRAEEYLSRMASRGVLLYGLQPRNGKNIVEVKVKAPALVLVGSESHGLPSDLPEFQPISIPMAGRVESLNAAMAATLCFYYFAFFSEPRPG